jgi:hypothetical protein
MAVPHHARPPHLWPRSAPARRPDRGGPAVLRLQRSVGNRAVAALVALQRDSPASDGSTGNELPVEPTAAERLTEAKAMVTSGEIDGPAFDHYRESNGKVADVVHRLWFDQLTLWDVDPSDKHLATADRSAATALRSLVTKRVTTALSQKFAALTKEVNGDLPRVAQQVEQLLTASPMWAEGTVADGLFKLWVGPVPLDSGSPPGATDFWATLRAAGGTAVAAARSTKLAKDPIAKLDSAEVDAVKAQVQPSAMWVVTPEETDALTVAVAGALGRPTAAADPAWKELRGRISTLLLVAETKIINEVIPQSKKIPLVPEAWARFRNRYVATITKPMWRYFTDNIVSATILGTSVSPSTDSSGVHKDVAAVLPLVEESAMRIGGFASRAELIKANQVPGSEFRFESMSHQEWMGNARHLSFHGTGRAMDFRAGKNPAFQGAAHEMVSILGGGELSELSSGTTQQRTELQKVAAHNADVVRLRDELQQRLAAATTDEDKASIQVDLDRVEAHLRDSPTTDDAVTRVRDRATDSHAEIKRIEAGLLVAWAEYTALRDAPADPAKGNDPKEDALAYLRQKVDDASTAAQAALDAATASKSGDVPTLTARLNRIEEVRTLMNNPKKSAQRDAMLKTVGSVAASGITDMPLWMVQAFTERGWQWGEWAGFSDAMHFDYMGPVADVRAEAQYL